MKKRILIGLLMGVQGFFVQATPLLTMDENHRLEASIGIDSMNRIAVVNDRITQIFGDEGTFESQHDETTGQIFLKPTAENGSKPLSLTLITEQGVTQDLTLKPMAKKPATLILKKPQRSEEKVFEVERQNLTTKQSFLQEDILRLLKAALKGQLSLKEETESVLRKAPEGFSLSYQKTYQAGSWSVQVFNVENLTETAIDLQEKDFYQRGDVALSCQQITLPKGGKTLLYVVRAL